MFDFRLGRRREAPRQFLGKFKVCCRRTGMPRTGKSEGRRWCMRDAGRMQTLFCRGGAAPLSPRCGGDRDRRANRRAVYHRCGGQLTNAEPGSTRYIAPGTNATAAGCDPSTDRSSAFHSTACGASQGFELRAHPVGSVDSLSGIPGTGVEQQLGGELDGTGGTRSKELDPHREHAGRTEDRGYSLGRGKPSPVEAPSARLLGCNPSRNSQRSDPGTI